MQHCPGVGYWVWSGAICRNCFLRGYAVQAKQTVSQDEWLSARKALLVKEKTHMRAGDALAAERRALPWLRIEKSYEFDTASGRRALGELFDGCDQLIVHHLMFAPEWEAA